MSRRFARFSIKLKESDRLVSFLIFLKWQNMCNL